MCPESRGTQGDVLSADVMIRESQAAGAQADADVEPSVAQLVAELASAGLISMELGDDGDVDYALTPQGQLSARLMAMSRNPHALVLLGALMGADDGPN